jgi:hypothetical protein
MCNTDKIVIFAALIMAIAAFSAAAEAKTVTMNLAFSFNGSKADIIRANGTSYLGTTTQERTFDTLGKKFLSAESGASVIGLVFAGKEFVSAQLNTSYSGTAYMLGMSQDEIDNRFLIAFTKGAWGNIDSKAQDAEDYGFVSGAFGDITFTIPEKFPFFVRLEYRNVDLLNRTVFRGPARLFVKNSGISGLLTNITTEVV